MKHRVATAPPLAWLAVRARLRACVLMGAALASAGVAAQPLVLPGAAPDGAVAEPESPAAAEAPRRPVPATKPRPVRPRPAPAAARPETPPAVPPPPLVPAPEALPGFEHLAPPPPPPPAAAPSAPRDPAARAKPGQRKGAQPAESVAAPMDAGPPLADDVPTIPAPVLPVVLPTAVTGTFQPMFLSDVSLLTRRRLLLADAPPLASQPLQQRRAVRTAPTATVAPLYAPMAFVPGAGSVYDPNLASPGMLEGLPLALNSIEALREGIPVGPFRAGLIEDNPGGSPRIETGTVVWQVEGDPAVTAERGPTAIKAIATIGRGPARITLVLRNESAVAGSGPLSMDLQVDIPGDAIVQAGIPEMRNSGIDRGVALYASVAGDPSRIRFAFAGNPSDGEQNVRMLAQRTWIDLPVRLRSGRKVVFAIEKGTAVRDMMREAFRLWRLPWLP